MMQLTYQRLRTGLSILILLLIASGCKEVKLLPDYDAELAKKIEETIEMVDSFYTSMIIETKDVQGERRFDLFSKQYAEIQVALNTIQRRNAIREKNQESMDTSDDLVKLWKNNTSVHKATDHLNDADIEGLRTSMIDPLNLLLTQEQFKFR